MTTTVDAAAEAAKFKQEIRAELAELPERLVLVGVLVADRGPSATYAEYAQRACQELGVDYQLRRATRLDVEDVIREANDDPAVHGIMVYYPSSAPSKMSTRDAVDPGKDFRSCTHSGALPLSEPALPRCERTKKPSFPVRRSPF
jgi:methylenetetrahydrofolate dehydrogenase (NADP+)/methenyltetrahydrofolate cyclohydrolase